MSLERATINWNAKQIKGMVLNGKIDFNHIVQRSYVWERARKSALIESMILGYPVPPVFAKRNIDNSGKNNNNVYVIMDGKQRLSTIKEYLNDEFAMTEVDPVTYFDDDLGKECIVDISEKKFSELPAGLQNHLYTVTFSIVYFDNLTNDEERELFKRLNAGKPLSAKSRSIASCKDITGLLDIGSHKLFSEMLTDKAMDNKNQVALVMKCYCMMFKDVQTISFESKSFNPLLEETEINEAEKLAMLEVFNMIVDVHDTLVSRKAKRVAKKLYTETHMVSLIPYFKKAIDDSISSDMMADWLVTFFDTKRTASVSDRYNASCSAGSAKNINIVARNEALNNSFNEFFKKDEELEDHHDDDHDDDDDGDFYDCENASNDEDADEVIDDADSEDHEDHDENKENDEAEENGEDEDVDELDYKTIVNQIFEDFEHTN